MKSLVDNLFCFFTGEYEFYHQLPHRFRWKAAIGNLFLYLTLFMILVLVFYPFIGWPNQLLFYIGMAVVAGAGILESTFLIVGDSILKRKFWIAWIMVIAGLGGGMIGAVVGHELSAVDGGDTYRLLMQLFFAVVLIASLVTMARLFIHVMKYLLAEKTNKEKDLELGREIQHSIVPEVDLDKDQFQIYGRTWIADEVGGDYFEVSPLANGTIALAIGDVSGKGVGAGLLMSMLKGSFLSEIQQQGSLSSVMQQLNRVVYKHSSRRMFVTFAAALFNPDLGELQLCNAGHLPLLLYRNKQRDIEQIKPEGIGLGLKQDSDYEQQTLKLEKGDFLSWFTDGYTEMYESKEQPFGVKDLQELMADYNRDGRNEGTGKLKELGEYFRETAMNRRNGSQDSSGADDMTMLLLQYK